MKPMAFAARDPSGPAEMELTRTENLRPASYASTRVSDSSADLADDIPPPYPAGVRHSLMVIRRVWQLCSLAVAVWNADQASSRHDWPRAASHLG